MNDLLSVLASNLPTVVFPEPIIPTRIILPEARLTGDCKWVCIKRIVTETFCSYV